MLMSIMLSIVEDVDNISGGYYVWWPEYTQVTRRNTAPETLPGWVRSSTDRSGIIMIYVTMSV